MIAPNDSKAREQLIMFVEQMIREKIAFIDKRDKEPDRGRSAH